MTVCNFLTIPNQAAKGFTVEAVVWQFD